jgi:glycosyltransferase involved in cell wall biosynthesis
MKVINVIIPAYNCRATLGRTLSSLVAQTDVNFEVIIVDDCSTEDIKSIIDDYNNKLNIIYIRNEHNLGCGMTRQVGIDNATQKFITFLDSDDMFMPYTVETFNSIIEANPNTEYLHSHFYEQTVIDNNPVLFLWKDNYTACHGKLYNVDLIRKHGIKNSPAVRWADDSFFNSMCSELMQMSVIGIPTVLWTNNKNSIMRRQDPERDAATKDDFLNAMLLSAEFVLERKGRIDHLQGTVERMVKQVSLNEKETEKFNKLLKYIRREL